VIQMLCRLCSVKQVIASLTVILIGSTFGGVRASDLPNLSFSGKPVYIESTEIEDERKRDNWSGRLGLGMTYAPDYFGSSSHTVASALDFKASWKDILFIENNKFGAVLFDRRLYRAGIITRANFGRDEDLSNTELAGFPDIDESFEVGVFAGTSLYKLFLSGELYVDVSEVHKGVEAELEAGYTFELNSRWSLTPIIGANWASKGYVDTYFGVPDALANQFDDFEAKSGFYKVFIEAAMEYRLGKNWLVKSGLSYARLTGSAASSPVVQSDAGSRNQLSSFLGIVWLF